MYKNWYNTENWYAPMYHEEPTEKKKKSPWKVISIITSVLLVAAIIGSSIIFRNEAKIILQLPANENDEELEEIPDTFQEYFKSFYTSVTTDIAQINIERVKVPVDFEVKIKESPSDELNFVQLYEKCSKSVVSIAGYTEGKAGYYWGTGFIIAHDGIIVTNTHVIDKCDSATVTLYDGSEYTAKLVGADSISDIAVLKIEAKGLKPVTVGDSSQIAVGQKVAAIGNPLGETFKYTLTDGLVSAIDRGISYNGHTMTLIQTNTALNEGNSGGPLFNMYGQVIGVTNMKMMSSYSNIEGIGFAIPSSSFSAIVNSILKDGEVRGRTSIGITVGAIPKDAAEKYDVPEGLYITEVSEGSDAEKKGIKPEDILIAVNGTPVNTTEDVAAIKNKYAVGDTLILTIFRNYETIDFSIILMDTNDIYKSMTHD